MLALISRVYIIICRNLYCEVSKTYGLSVLGALACGGLQLQPARRVVFGLLFWGFQPKRKAERVRAAGPWWAWVGVLALGSVPNTCPTPPSKLSHSCLGSYLGRRSKMGGVSIAHPRGVWGE